MQRINGKRLQIAEFRILLRNRCLGIERHLAYKMQKKSTENVAKSLKLLPEVAN